MSISYPKTPYGRALKTADGWCSKYIRTKDADDEGNVICATCYRKKHWKEVDAGHCFGRANMGTRFDERNLAPQCKFCNDKRYGNGRAAEFALHIINKYGIDVLNELRIKANTPYRMTEFELREIATMYREKFNAIKRERNIFD